jgi:hypothetical protein
MAQWGNIDQAVTLGATPTDPVTSDGAPIGTYALVKGDQVNRVDGANAHFGDGSPGSRSETDSNMYGNTTQDAFITGKAVGVFGYDPAEVAADPAIPHAGWVLRTEGSGGRAGRVQYEVLVAMSSIV